MNKKLTIIWNKLEAQRKLAIAAHREARLEGIIYPPNIMLIERKRERLTAKWNALYFALHGPFPTSRAFRQNGSNPTIWRK